MAVRKMEKDNSHSYKIFYIDVSRSLCTFLKTWYNLEYLNEYDAVKICCTTSFRKYYNYFR